MNKRFIFFIVHIYLAFRHAIYVEEAEEMYHDFTRGRRSRNKAEKKARIFNLDKSK